MVLQHVARGAAAVVIAAAGADAEFFGDGDLDVVDVATVPEGLEDRVGETQDEEILDGLLAEVVVDAEDLRLAEVAGGDGVEVDGGIEVLAERLLDDDLAFEFGADATTGEAGLAEVLEDGLEDRGRGRDVEDQLEGAAGALLGGGDLLLQGGVGLGVVVTARLVGGVVLDALPDVGAELAAGELLDVGGGLGAELGVRYGLTAEADQVEVRRQEAVDRQVVQGGQELTGGQVAGGAEDDHAGRLGAAVLAQAGKERMAVGVGHRSLEAATPEEDFATVLKEADGAFLANQNFHDVEARMTRTPDLAEPSAGGPPQSPLFPSIHRPIPFPALVGVAGLDLDEDEHFALEDDEVELVAAMSPVDREAPAALPAIMRFG